MVRVNSISGIYQNYSYISKGLFQWPAGLKQLDLSLKKKTYAKLCHCLKIIVWRFFSVYLAFFSTRTSKTISARGKKSGKKTFRGEIAKDRIVGEEITRKKVFKRVILLSIDISSLEKSFWPMKQRRLQWIWRGIA